MRFFCLSIFEYMISQKTYTLKEALSKMETYCAYQERCHKEVFEKLKEMGMIPQVIDHIMVHLVENNYLNEERFSKSFARGKFRIKKWGKLRIIRELALRDISKYNIETALKEIDEQEYLTAFNELAEKQYKKLLQANRLNTRRKFISYLVYRGWESHLIYDKINQLSKPLK